MKTILKVYSVLLFTALLVSGQVYATGDPLVKKTKNYSKTYAVNSSDKVSFDNKFGALKINTWNKNEVKVDITMSAEANTDAKAQQILDAISIDDGKSGSGVYFKTKIEKKDKNKDWEKGEKQGFEINYVVYMPAGNPLNAENQFGDFTIADYTGEATLTSKFGSLTTGKLSNVKKISVEFGQGTIGGISNGDITIKFSKAIISNISGSIDGNFEFSGVKLNVSNAVKDLDIKNNFADLYLDLSNNLSASFDISTHFGEFSNKSNFSVDEEKKDSDRKRYGPNFNHSYNGKAGGGSTPVKIKASFGSITLGHNLSDDVIKNKGAKKVKVKSKTTNI